MEFDMNNGASILILTLAIGVTLVASFAVVTALFPAATSRTRKAMVASPGTSFAIGLVNSLFMGGIALALAGLADGLGAGLLRVPAVGLFALLVILMTFGLTAAAEVIGQRLFPDRSATASSLLGGLALVLACLTPFVGWFGILPYVTFLGVGGFILSLFRKAPEPPGE
jgi:hypothetical protein